MDLESVGSKNRKIYKHVEKYVDFRIFLSLLHGMNSNRSVGLQLGIFKYSLEYFKFKYMYLRTRLEGPVNMLICKYDKLNVR